MVVEGYLALSMTKCRQMLTMSCLRQLILNHSRHLYINVQNLCSVVFYTKVVYTKVVSVHVLLVFFVVIFVNCFYVNPEVELVRQCFKTRSNCFEQIY